MTIAAQIDWKIKEIQSDMIKNCLNSNIFIDTETLMSSSKKDSISSVKVDYMQVIGLNISSRRFFTCFFELAQKSWQQLGVWVKVLFILDAVDYRVKPSSDGLLFAFCSDFREVWSEVYIVYLSFSSLPPSKASFYCLNFESTD